MEAEKKVTATHVIMIANAKGGVAKTTNTINLASALHERGKRILIVDLDATGGATKALGAPSSGWHSSYDLITGGAPPSDCIIQSGDEEVKLPPGVDLVPASRQLLDLDQWLGRRENKWRVHQDLLLEPIAKLRGSYDYILLDTPPQVTHTTLPAMKASDFVILSTMPETASTDQLAEAMEDVRTCQLGANPNLKLLGIIISAMPKPQTVLARQLNEYIRRSCVDPAGQSYRFETVITRTTVVQEARAKHTSVLVYAGDSKVADQYRELGKEVLMRVEAITRSSEGPPVAAPDSSAGAQELAAEG